MSPFLPAMVKGPLFCSPSPTIGPSQGVAAKPVASTSLEKLLILLLSFLYSPKSHLYVGKSIFVKKLSRPPGAPSSPVLALSPPDAAGETEWHRALPVGHQHHPRRGADYEYLTLRGQLWPE